MERTFLYIDILGFENLVLTNPSKVNKIFKVLDRLKVHRHFALKTVVFSDTILVFNVDESHPNHYYCTYLVEYAQELFYKLSEINIYFKGILTLGEFNFSQMNNIQAYYGFALIDAYKDEKSLDGFGLYVNKKISDEVVIFEKAPFNEKYDFILLCQSVVNLYNTTNGILPVAVSLFTETDTFHRIDEDCRFFREIKYLKLNHPNEKVRGKYQKVYDIYRKRLELFFDFIEKDGFFVNVICPGYMVELDYEDLISESESEFDSNN